MPVWNPWHGCKKYSSGCLNCYVYRRDESIGKDSRIVMKTADFALPLRKNRKKEWKLLPGGEPVYTCMTSDFFLEDADVWRAEAWAMMRARSDLQFVIITKRILRFQDCLPLDWGSGYPNVCIMCTCENQAAADERLPVFLEAPVRRRAVILEPMLEEIHLERYLASGKISLLTCGGESGPGARLCDYAWVLSARGQCLRYGVRFHFMQTGAVFRKDGRIYRLRRQDQLDQARRAGIDIEERGGDAGALEVSGAQRAVPQPVKLPQKMPVHSETPRKKFEGTEKKEIQKLEMQKPKMQTPQMQRREMREAKKQKGAAEAQNFAELFARLSRSAFRSRFCLGRAEVDYVREKGYDTIERHAAEFVRTRLAPASPPNDGKQTPMRGHPVFLAQHATATCCRGCLAKWHRIPAGRALTEAEQRYVTAVIMAWIRRQCGKAV